MYDHQRALYRRDRGRAELVAAWADLVRQRRVISAQDARKLKTTSNPKGAGRGHGGISQTARDLGMKRDAVARHLTVAALSPEAKAKARKVVGMLPEPDRWKRAGQVLGNEPCLGSPVSEPVRPSDHRAIDDRQEVPVPAVR